MISNVSKLANLRQIKEQKDDARKRNLMILIIDYLDKLNFKDATQLLWTCTGLQKANYAVADNIDLLHILQDYETYHEIKFNRAPKLIRKIDLAKQNSNTVSRRQSEIKQSPRKSLKMEEKGGNEEKEVISEQSLDIQGTSALMTQNKSETIPICEEIIDSGERVLLKPLALGSSVGNVSEYNDLIQIIQRDIFIKNPNVHWDDIAGLDASKRLLKEAIIYPLRFPELFQGIIEPWNGVLLYGIPGCGKTLLAKAVASECKTTFFNISASSIVSKWRGESEKLVRALFDMARHYAPSTIFLDELDAIMSSRSSEGEHEGSRRMKTELLIQMDGLAKSDERVFVLAASNLPWELDSAMIRRLEKRIHIELPDTNARVSMLKKRLPLDLKDGFGNEVVEKSLDYGWLADQLLGYSGSDIKSVCKEALMIPLRSVISRLETQDETIVRDKVTTRHVIEAIAKIKPSCNPQLNERYKKWAEECGSN